MDVIAATIGVALFSYALIRGAGNPRSLISAETLDGFVLPVLLTIAYFPLVHFVALYSRYDRRRRMQRWRACE